MWDFARKGERSTRAAVVTAALVMVSWASACGDAANDGDGGAGASAGEAGTGGDAGFGTGGSTSGNAGEAGAPIGGEGSGGTTSGGASGSGDNGGSAGHGGDADAGEAGDGGSSGAGAGGEAGSAGEAGNAGEDGTGGGAPDHFPMPMPNPVESGLPNPHSYTSLGDGTVHDNVTGLTWMVTPYPKPGDNSVTTRTYAQARQYCADLVLGDYDDWRVPNRVELVSILDYTRWNPALEPVAFVAEGPNKGSNTVSESVPTANGRHWIDFQFGRDHWSTYEAQRGYVRCVRPALPEPRPRYTVGTGPSSGIVLDNLTGLRWQRVVPSMAESWQGATDYCASLAIGDQTNFRLPSMKELQTLVLDGVGIPRIDSDAFPDTPGDTFLTSSPYVLPNALAPEVWNVNFVSGSVQENIDHLTYRVRCVADDDGTPWRGGAADPCADRSCSGHGTCAVVSGEARCTCDSGFVRDAADPRTCVDSNECATNNGGCDALVACVNTVGGRRCRECPPGYRGSAETGCTPITDCPCKNGGVCVAHGAGTVCHCPDSFVGATCDVRFVTLAPGVGFTCAIRSDGAAQCWGKNTEGQALAPTGTFKAIASGTTHACAIRSDDSIVCWGSGATPPPAGSFRAVAAAASHTCAIRTDGTLACWGSNTSGQSTPPSGTFERVTAGPAHSCAIRSDGTLACWGDSEKSTLPSVIVGQRFSAVAVYAIPFEPRTIYTCGLQSDDGLVRCWGSAMTTAPARPGTYSALAGDCGLRSDGSIACSYATAPAGTFTAIAAGANHTCAIRSDGTIHCFGAVAIAGQRELGQMVPPSGAFTRVARTCAVRVDGAIVCWGRVAGNGFADLSSWASPAIRLDGTLDYLAGPDPEHPLPPGTFDRVEGDTYHLLALGTDGFLTRSDGSSDPPVARPPSGSFSAVTVGDTHQCALGTNGRFQCWGISYLYGQVVAPSDTFTAINAHNWTTCAIRESDQAIQCWGDNRLGEATPPPGTYKALSPNGRCAIRTDGSVVFWPTPRQAWYTPPPGTFDAVGGTPSGGCGIASDMTLHCWGSTVR